MQYTTIREHLSFQSATSRGIRLVLRGLGIASVITLAGLAAACGPQTSAAVPAAAVGIADECTGECGQDERTANAAIERAYRAYKVAGSGGMPVIIGADALELTIPAHVYGKGPKAGYYLSKPSVVIDGVAYSVQITITDLATVPAKVKVAK